MDDTLTQAPAGMFLMTRGRYVACRTLMVLLTVFVALCFNVVPAMGIGCGGLEYSTDYYFGPCNWLIITHSSMIGLPDATLVVINPRGVAWAVSVICLTAALFRLGWLKTKWQ